MSENLNNVLHSVGTQGFPLLFLHIFPFFQHPETFFEAVVSYLDPLATYLSRKNVERLFSAPVIRLFDSPIEPFQRGQMLSRSMADCLLRRFGLKVYLNRFIGFIIEAVIEPSMILSKGCSRKTSSYLFRLKSASALTLVQSGLFQSTRFEEMRNNSDFNYSFALSEVPRGYDSDKDECSSGDSDEQDYPEASLLAKSGLVLGAVNETEGGLSSLQEEDEGQTQSPMLYRKLDESAALDREQQKTLPPELSVDPLSLATSSLPPSGSGRWPKLDDSAHFPARQTGHERLHPGSISATSSLRIDTASNEYKPSADSPGLISQSGGMSSIFSEVSQDVSTTSSEVASPYITLNRQSSLALGRPIVLSVDDILGEVGEDSEDEQTVDNESLRSTDPQIIAINLHMSEVAADCICWLIRRLGPFLTTRYIARPLLDNLHRCFTGILHLKRREVVVMNCLRSFAVFYGDMVITKLYIPYAETLVS